MGYDEPEILLKQKPSNVPQALTGNSEELPPSAFAEIGALPIPNETAGGQDCIVSVAPHAVRFDRQDRKLWYTDIQIKPPQGAYFPFIRLALARYNPVSVPGAHLSSPVLAAFQQLTPDRLATVTRSRDGATAHVAIYGVGAVPGRSFYKDSTPFDETPHGPAAVARAPEYSAEIQVLYAGADEDTGWRTADVRAAPSARATRATARRARRSFQSGRSLQNRARAALESGDVEAFRQQPDLAFALRPPLLWETTITLPPSPAGGKRRLVVTEREVFPREFDDLNVYEEPPIRIPANAPQPAGSRIVYFEVLDL